MKANKGFTLVELLVVIGIISVLIAMLLPALNKARQQAQVVQCMSNMRQIGMGIQMYTQQNKGMFPPRKLSDPGYIAGHWLWINLLLDSRVIASDITPSKTTRYSKVFYCPAFMAGSAPINMADPDNFRVVNGLTSYSLNYALDADYTNWDGSSAIRHGVRISQVRQPAETILVIEGNVSGSGSYYVLPYYSSGTGHVWAWHPKDRCNVLWVDGHVSTVQAPVQDDYKNDYKSFYTANALGRILNRSSKIDPCYWDTN
jgi:general secretion pathway protein G